MTTPLLTAWVDDAHHTVQGQAPAGSLLRIYLSEYANSDLTTWVTAMASGAYTAIFDAAGLPDYLQGYVTCFDAQGFQAMLYFGSAYWQVTLDSESVYGRALDNTPPLTLTLQAADGSYTEVITSSLVYGSASFYIAFEHAIQPGDQLAMESRSGSFDFTVPILSAAHEFARQALEGYAPPGSRVEAVFRQGYYGGDTATRHVWAGADGHYGVDTSDLDLRPGQSGTVTVVDPAGNITIRQFVILGYRQFLPLLFK